MVRSPRRVEPLPPEPDRVRRSGSERVRRTPPRPKLVGGSGDQPGPADAVFADLKAELDRVPNRLEDRDLQGIDNAEIINTIHHQRAPMIPATAGLRL